MKYVIITGSNHPDYKNGLEHGPAYKNWVKTTRGTEVRGSSYTDINQAHRHLPPNYVDNEGWDHYYLIEECP